VGTSPHPPLHTTAQTHHLKAHAGLANPAAGPARDPDLLHYQGDLEPPSHSINLTFILPSSESQLHSMRKHKASRDTALPRSALVTFARSDWDIDLNLNLLYPVGLDHRPEPVLTLSGRSGISTRASTRNPARSDWMIETSLHKFCPVGLGRRYQPPHTHRHQLEPLLFFFLFLERKKKKGEERKKPTCQQPPLRVRLVGEPT
jgi:hypothetical protein